MRTDKKLLISGVSTSNKGYNEDFIRYKSVYRIETEWNLKSRNLTKKKVIRTRVRIEAVTSVSVTWR